MLHINIFRPWIRSLIIGYMYSPSIYNKLDNM